MESSNINQTWKSQTVVSEINTGLNFKNRTAADELTLLRDKQLKRALLVLPVHLLNLGLAINSFYRFYTGAGTPVGAIGATVLTCIVLLGFYQLYQLYKWRQAEIFTDTQNYLTLSRNFITAYLNRSEKAQYFAWVVFPMLIGTFYYTVDPLKFKIFTGILVAVFISMLVRNKAMMRSMHNTYDPIVAKIDEALNALQSAQ